MDSYMHVEIHVMHAGKMLPFTCMF